MSFTACMSAPSMIGGVKAGAVNSAQLADVTAGEAPDGSVGILAGPAGCAVGGVDVATVEDESLPPPHAVSAAAVTTAASRCRCGIRKPFNLVFMMFCAA